MIDLTPLEVRKKKGDFRRVMRGYESQSVDDFLDLVADRMEQLVRENMALHERIAASDSHVSDYRERERALTEALVTAQEMREEMRRQMEREADLMRREAEAEADAIRGGAVGVREREEENIRRLRARQSQFVQGYRGFLERELAELAAIAETLDFGAVGDEEAVNTPRKRAQRTERAERAERTEPPVTVPAPELVLAIEPESVPALKSIAELQRELEIAAQVDPELDALPADPTIDQTSAEAGGEELDETTGLASAEAADDQPELELIDEVTAEEETDGWVSSLLEGKGD